MKRFRRSVFFGLALGCLWGVSVSGQVANRAAGPPIPDTLDLNDSIVYALDNNFAIQQAKQRIAEQIGLVIEVRAQALPKATLDASYNQLDTGLFELGALFPAPENDWRIALTLRQALYKGGGVRAALQVQRLVEEAALLDLQAVINDALLDVRTRFYDTLLAREKIAVQEQNVAVLEEQLAETRDRYEVGSVSQFEVLRAEVELANAQTPLIRSRNNFRIAVEELRRALGFIGSDPAQLEKVPEFAGELEFAPVDFDIAIALEAALENRPELASLKAVAEARKLAITVEKAERWPELDLVGAYQLNKASSSNRFDDSLTGWTVGIQSTWALFDGQRRRGKILQARSRLEQAKLNYDEAILSVEIEARRAVSNLQEATELAEASRKVVEQAEEALRLASARYDAGEATQLDVLQARVSLTQARTNQLEAFHGYNVAKAALRKAMGVADAYLPRDK